MKFKLFASVCVAAGLAFGLAGCGDDNAPKAGAAKTLTVGASPVPHADILNVVAPQLQKEGITLKVIEFSDYIQPNISLNDKELDANFFQHKPYLDSFCKDRGLKLASLVAVHIEPMGVYSHKVKNVADIAEGSEVAIPNDPTNGGRALLLLQKAGLLKLKDGVAEKATVQDIAENPHNFKFQEVEAAQVPRTLDDVDAAVINTNYAMQIDLVPTKDALIMEDSTSPYVNIVAIRAGDENRPEIQALIKALKSEEVKNFINEKYKGAVVPAF